MWYKDGIAYTGPKMGDSTWYIAHGYTTTPPEPPPVEPAPKRYSKLALHDAVGDAAWLAIVNQLTDEQRRRLDLANELSTADADFAAALNALAAGIDNADAVLAAAEIKEGI